MNWIRVFCLVMTTFMISCSTTKESTEQDIQDSGSTAPDLQTLDGATGAPVPCGKGTCPNANYICCQENKDAPPECCLKGYNACYSGGGGITGWPPYNGCNVTKCLQDSPRTKHCKAGSRGTCCQGTDSCGEAWGIGFCEDKGCPADRKCNGGKLCCSKPGMCKPYKNVEYCDEPCETQGKVKCSLTGSHYGKEQTMHVCCPKGECHNHPDGWPFCLNEAY